ncbi:phenylacetate--CoA ligase family protein [Capnocytophaga cynodegmi]|uniref:Uncharacterized protein n=1 Tax=Capnocytophaga cynodegmi TaxID=28189 RepID=A0A0B7HBH2_9FLAO|nr:phenylacetate--CoA ligase family protein [Capnocytophaga cynodegmi]CEN35909.1 conserved hypothetical protein [Capnocytophaga cynodegmi]CEN36588.1 conserved hypothetical protein [Capnocytophaga cynodegmi]
MKNIRNYVFWAIDFVTGGKKRAFYEEIRKVYYQTNGYEKITSQRLSEILSYAYEKVPFYKGIDCSSITNFPVITKKIINSNYNDFFSTDYINKKNRLRLMTTSGSTGTTFKVFQNSDKVLRNKIDALFFYEIGNYSLGDRIYSLRVWTHLNRKKKLSCLKENLKMIDTSDLCKRNWNSFKSDMLNYSSPKIILAYASSLTEFLNSLSDEEKKLKWGIKSIFSGAEELPLHVKRELKKVFKCPIVSRYSNQEMGIFAQQPISGEEYFLTNDASYYFEFLKLDSDKNAQEDEIARIVVTDLFNKAMPLIRYDTGDLCTFGTRNNRKYIKVIQGRTLDLLKSKSGQIYSPYTIILLLWNFKGIIQFQFIQEDLNFIVLRLVHNFENKEQSFKDIEENLRSLFGKQTTIKIEEVTEIPSEKTGKRRYIISKLNINDNQTITK